MDKEKPSYYAILPANVRYDPTISSSEKILYAEITALSSSSGVCFATNGYFAKLYGVTNRTIIDWINNLCNRGYLIKHIDIDEDTNQVLNRYLQLPNAPPKTISLPSEENFTTPSEKNFTTPSEENFTHNNINKNNNIKNNKKENNYPMDSIKEKATPTYEEVLAYATERGYPQIAERFFMYYDDTGWKDKNGSDVKNWKLKFVTWENKEKEHQQSQPKPQPQQQKNTMHNKPMDNSSFNDFDVAKLFEDNIRKNYVDSADAIIDMQEF